MNTLEQPRPQTQTRLRELILLRYACKACTAQQVRTDVGRLLKENISTEQLQQVQEALVQAGYLSKGRGASLKITPRGRQQVAVDFGIEALPEGTTWSIVVARYLAPVAIGLSTAELAKLKNGEQLAMYLLKQQYQLPGTVSLTKKAVLEALVCQLLGHPEETSLEGLLCGLLSPQCNATGRLTKQQLGKEIPYQKLHVSSLGKNELYLSAVRKWLQRSLPTSAANTEPFDLASFAQTVLRMAKDSPAADRYFENKVFIAPLWRSTQKEPSFPRLTLAEFKQHLLAANAQNFLHLSRADLVQVMDEELVRESATSSLNATFHFVLLE